MTLARLQHDMIAWLRSGDPARAADLGGGAGPGVYLNNHRAALMAALENAYAQTRRWLGDAAFAAAAAHHIESHHPGSWTLDAYGEGFAATLGGLYPGEPDHADLARLEWAVEQAFIAPDARPLSAADLARVDWEAARLSPVPSASLRWLTSNAAAILAALIDETEPPRAETLPQPVAVLVWRQGFVPRFRQLEPDEPILADGLGFADLCAELAARYGTEEGITRAGQALARWVADEVVQVPGQG